MSEEKKSLPEGHVSTLTPEQIAEGLRKIAHGSTDGGRTLPKPKAFEPFDARTATKEEIARHAKKHGLQIKNF